MRLTGLALFVLALAHFIILHFVYDPAPADRRFIPTSAGEHLLARLDWLMLMLVLFHSFLGMRTVVQRLHPRRRSRRRSRWALYLGAILFVLGTIVVMTLPSGPAGDAADDHASTTRSSSAPAAPA